MARGVAREDETIWLIANWSYYRLGVCWRFSRLAQTIREGQELTCTLKCGKILAKVVTFFFRS
jgi:hypothetical protein